MSSSQMLTPPPRETAPQSQEIAPAPQEMTQNLMYSTVMETLNHPKQLPNQSKNETKGSPQTITEITDELKKILLSYLKLDPQNTATYFKSANSLLESKKLSPEKITSLKNHPIPHNIKIALILRGKNNMYTLSPEEQEELTEHLDRKVITYLLIRNNITKIHTLYELIAFKQLLMMIKNSGSKLGGRGWAISCNMGKTIDSLIAYINKIEQITISSKIIQDVVNISDNTLKFYLAKRIQFLNSDSSQVDFDMHNTNIADRKDDSKKINDLGETKKSLEIKIEEVDNRFIQNDSNKNQENVRLDEILTNINTLQTQKELMEKNDENIPSELTEEIDFFHQKLILVNDMIVSLEEQYQALVEIKKSLINQVDLITEQLITLNRKQELIKENISYHLEYFTAIQDQCNAFREIEIDRPVIAKLDAKNLNFLKDLIKNILAAIYTDPLTKDALIPIIEGFSRKTQMAFLLSIASLIGSGINFFTNPSLINLTLDYLMEGTLTSDAISDKVILKEVVKISSLSIFSSTPDATTLAIEEPLENNQTANSSSL